MKNLQTIATETLDIISIGSYYANGQLYNIEDELLYSKCNTELIDSTPVIGVYFSKKTRVKVVQSTTVAAIHKSKSKTIALNFASAKNPGGGFKNGANAQEESLARASGLYNSIEGQHEFYKSNSNAGAPYYTNNMLYSPDVPFFRNDAGDLVASTEVSIITAPAINLNGAKDIDMEYAAEIMIQRIQRILYVAYTKGYNTIILGAWGCGVFKNNPSDVARYFKSFVKDRLIENVIFAIPDTETFNIFKTIFNDK